MSSKVDKPIVMIVDDTPTNIRVLAESLRTDYRIRVAPSGQAALELIERQGSPDLILLDIMMPEMDGYEVCRRLKENPATKGIPVIFVTARDDAVDEERGLRLGAVDYIVKPFHLPIVAARVHNHIKLKMKSDLLESLAMLDALTNIPNRRRFDESLQEEWLRARRSMQPISIIMADIDHFKRYNDHYGHGAGDICLIKVATALASSVERPGDLVARFGGEEFIALLPETNFEGARLVAERFRNHVEALQLTHKFSKASDLVSISVGFSTVHPHLEDDANVLLKQADHMLYQAKRKGRNRVYGAEQKPLDPEVTTKNLERVKGIEPSS